MARIGLLFLVVACSTLVFSQTTPTRIRSVTSLPATCQPGDGVQQTDFVTLIAAGSSVLYRCASTNTWVAMFDISGTTWSFNPVTGAFTFGGSGTAAIYVGQDNTCTWSAPVGNYIQLCNLLGVLTANVNNGSNNAIAILDSNNDIPAVNANPAPEFCGTTTTCSATALASAALVMGKVTLSGGTATVTGFNPGFTSTSSYVCFTNDITTIANPSKAVPATATSITVTGTGTDVINYICGGN